MIDKWGCPYLYLRKGKERTNKNQRHAGHTDET